METDLTPGTYDTSGNSWRSLVFTTFHAGFLTYQAVVGKDSLQAKAVSKYVMLVLGGMSAAQSNTCFYS